MRGEPPVLQHPVILDSGITIHIDLAYPDEKLGIETDGPEHLTKKAFERDRQRDRELSDLDWMVLRVTSAQWRADPQGVIDSILRVRSKRRSRQ